MRAAVNPRGALRRAVIAAAILPAAWSTASPTGAHAAPPNVLRVGTYNAIPGTFLSIQQAVNAAVPGDWILVGPGDYHEQADYADNSHPAGVWIDKPSLHLRGMDRNGVIVDGTKGTTACSPAPADQDPGPVTVIDPSGQGRNGIEVHGLNFTADSVSIDNLTVCNFLTSAGGAQGNEIWWNGGDGMGMIGLSGYSGTYLTATSTYSSTTPNAIGPCCGVSNPSGSYGIFSSNSTHGLWQNDYASNMSDSGFYVGACQQRCDMTMDQDHAQNSSLCLSSTNAGGYFVVQNTECDLNKTGLVNNSQNNDDWPSPQHGACDTADLSEPQQGILHTSSCTVWLNNNLHDNNNPNVPGNGVGGLAGGGPVGTGLILAGSSDITVTNNTIQNNNSWGELIVDLPDQEDGPAMCQGGIPVAVPSQTTVCYYRAVGNISLGNHFLNNGSYGNPSNGDVGLATLPNNPNPGNCLSGDTDPLGGPAGSAGTDPPPGGAPPGNPAGVENPLNPLSAQYQPSGGACTNANAGDEGVLAGEALCASQLVVACPTLQSVVCQLWPGPGACPLQTLPSLPANYPRPDAVFTLSRPAATLTPTMPDPCAGVPVNPWCPMVSTATPEFPLAALPALAGGVTFAVWALGTTLRRRRRAA